MKKVNQISKCGNQSSLLSIITWTLVAFLFISTTCHAQMEDSKLQRSTPTLDRHWVDLGVGVGLDYGGFVGIKGAFLPIPNLSVFGSAGYYLIGLGWNTGITWHILAPGPKRWIRPNLKLMYGTNGATVVSGAKSYNKIFTGLTPGFGIELRFGRGKRNGFDLDINVPIHGNDFHNQVDRMKSDERLVGAIKILPVAISFGYHHAF